VPLLDVEQTYIGELVAITERPYDGPTRYRDDGTKVENGTSVIWKFRLVDSDGVLVTDPDGGDWTLWGWSSDSTFLDTKGGGRTARARLYLHALAGRELSDDEVARLLVKDDGTPTLPTQLVGRRVRIEVKPKTGANGNPGWQIERMRPLREQPVQSVTVQKKAAAAVIATRSDDADLPF